ncbi:MAG: trehalose-6-phosphate synthase [Dehalococcoidia bacterium]
MTAPRLVVVSNRVPAAGSARASVGGLVAALRPAIEERGGVWFGWSGVADDDPVRLTRRDEGTIEFVTCDLTSAEVAGYYEGFCNRTLWPLMHGLVDRAEVRADDYAAWRAVNARFAALLAPMLRPSDLVWVHDYHLVPLGIELRAAGWRGRTGYFHHIPIPERREWASIPQHGEVAACLAAYDLVGVQTARDASRLRSYLDPGAGERVRAFPIGIDPERMQRLAGQHPGDPFEARGGRQVLLGLDRLDYTKGIPDRLRAFERLLERRPSLRDEALLVQWSAPSREGIPDYRAERLLVDGLVARLSGLASPSPVEARNEVLPAETVAAALRDAEVCLVTSRSDGMNLVAKEYVAVQRPESPGVLVLTDGCGAAEELREALIVPSGDLDGIAEAMERALEMPLDERRARWRGLSERVDAGHVSGWSRRYLDALVGGA